MVVCGGYDRVGPMTTPFRLPVLSDERIAALLGEPKEAPSDWVSRVQPGKGEGMHLRGRLELAGAEGNEFVLATRQHRLHPQNFSVILEHHAEGHRYRLVRCNGLHPGGHRNVIEGSSFGTTFHVHRATERYQRAGKSIDGYAEEDSSFSSLHQAIVRLAEMTRIAPGVGRQLWML